MFFLRKNIENLYSYYIIEKAELNKKEIIYKDLIEIYKDIYKGDL